MILHSIFLNGYRFYKSEDESVPPKMVFCYLTDGSGKTVHIEIMPNSQNYKVYIRPSFDNMYGKDETVIENITYDEAIKEAMKVLKSNCII